ncbi:MAG: hypothetical protein KAI83_19455 [Thiomargarita sp.]|nr:hypothetical protein [Thiomargarita sp.]
MPTLHDCNFLLVLNLKCLLCCFANVFGDALPICCLMKHKLMVNGEWFS